MRVLVVKTSSLGDIIHTLPALSDAKAAYPKVSFDWVVEESFQEVPLWHHAVKHIIPTAFRRWRQQKWNSEHCGEMLRLVTELRKEKYDYIVDAQGLFKSVILTLLSRGTQRIGLSWQSAREPLVSLFYQKRAIVPWGQHAVERTRSLFAKALEYTLPSTAAEYGINFTPVLDVEDILADPYYVFLHGTTWPAKKWPEVYWIELAKIAANAGYRIQLLWGNEEELARANRIANQVKKALVMPHKLTLREIMRVLANAKGVVSVDTGLGHLAAALGIPTVSLYGPTDPNHAGTFGNNQTNLAASFACAPCYNRVCTYEGAKPVDPPCFAAFPPQLVWEQLTKSVEVRTHA